MKKLSILAPVMFIAASLACGAPSAKEPSNEKVVKDTTQQPASQPIEGGEFILKGQLNAPFNSPSRVYLYISQGGAMRKDSCMLKNGAFEFNGTIDEPVIATLYLSHDPHPDQYRRGNEDGKLIWLEKGNITLTGKDSLSTSRISGASIQVDYDRLLAALKPFRDQSNSALMTFRAAYKAKKDVAAAQKKYNEEAKKMDAAIDSATWEFIRNNPDSYISLTEIDHYSTRNAKDPKLLALYTGLSDRVKKCNRGKIVGTLLRSSANLEIGMMAPNFTQNDTEGKPVSLSDFRGKYVLIDFWASWCGPCREEAPTVVKAYNKFKDKNFTILGVSLDSPPTKAAWLRVIKSDKLAWHHVSDLKFWDNAAAVMYAVRAVPANFLIDPQGKIIAKELHGAELEKTLAKYLH